MESTELESFFEYISSKQAPIKEEPVKTSGGELSAELSLFLDEFLQKKATPKKKFERKTTSSKKLAPKKKTEAAIAKPKDGRTPLLRKSEVAIEWKYSDETDWRELITLDELRESSTPRENFEERFNTADLLGGGGHGPVPEFRVEGNTFLWKLSTQDEWQELFDIPSPGGTSALEFTSDDDAVYWRDDPAEDWQIVFEKEDAVRTKRIDMVGDYIYTGEADVGTSEASALWRVSRTYIAPTDGDVIILWAEGNSNFDNAWADHLILSYS